MANTDRPIGFVPVRHRAGSPYNGAANLYLATTGSNIFVGDAVLITGESNNVEFEGNPPGSVPIVKLAGTGNNTPISGVVVGVVPTNADSNQYYAGTKTDTGVWVCDDPDMLFEVQADAALATHGDVGMATSLLTTHAGSTVTGRSGMEVDATVATQGQFVIERLAPKANNDVKDTGNPKVWVSVRRHTMGLRGANVSGSGIGIS